MEFFYILFSEVVKKGVFECFFQYLECSLDVLYFSSFGLMDIILEEVFFKVLEEDQLLENSEVDVKEFRKDVFFGVEGMVFGEGYVGNLVWCLELVQLQVLLQLVLFVGFVCGDEGVGYVDVYGDYCFLFDNLQDLDNVSL